MEKMKMQSLDVVGSNIEKIKSIFPSCITERMVDGKVVSAIDFKKLQAELCNELVGEGEERYQFTWPDKRKAIREANTPTTMTLRPCKEESVDFDNTQNLYIEGDNLEVLKVLQETYLGKIKMIYIDPPYNTGNDFVYNDDFAKTRADFEDTSGLFDENGNLTVDPMVRNTESNGRFHTDWLNMMYPRLKVARSLLTDDGVIFISIDNNELINLVKICNDIYGEANMLGIISNTNNPKGRSDDKYIATAHEYIIVYAKNIILTEWLGFEPTEEITKRYNKIDINGNKYREIDLRKTGENDLREDRPNLFYYFYYNPTTHDFYPSKNNIEIEGYIQIKPQREDGKEGNWRWGLETAKLQIEDLVPKFMPARKVWGVMQKDYLEGRGLVKPTTSWTFKDVNSERGTEEFINLGFDKRIFPKPKPIGTIKRCIKLCSAPQKDSIILDFFSGSATTAHAAMCLNAEDDSNRKFIMVQLPELTDKKSEAYKAGYENICEIGKERIRRAGRKVKEDFGLKAQNLDIGFRVLKLDSSNMEDVYYTPEVFDASKLFVDNVKPDRTEQDLLFQTMLDLGIELSAKIESRQINGKTVQMVDNNYLVACFDENINESTITEIAKIRPIYFVMRDASASNDNVIDNFEQIFRHYSPDTNCRII